MDWTTAVVALVAAFAGGGLVGAIMNARNEARKISLDERQAISTEWQQIRAEVDAQLEACRAREVKMLEQLELLRTDLQQTRGDLGRAQDELVIVRRQIGEVAEGAPDRRARTRTEDRED